MRVWSADTHPSRPWRAGILWRVMALVWLLYLAFPVKGLLASRVGAALVALEFALAALFVATYVYLVAGRDPIDLPGRTGWLLAALLAALATALCLLRGTNWLGLFIYVAAAVGARRPFPRAAMGLAATIALALLLEWRLGQSPFGSGGTGTGILVTEIVAVGGLLIGLTRLVEVNGELLRTRDRAARLAVSEERVRFARDLHDLLGHTLAVIVLKSELMARLAASDPTRAAQEAREVEAIARTALRDVREAVAGYRHPRLDAELRGLRLALESAGAEVSIDNRAPSLPNAVQAAFA